MEMVIAPVSKEYDDALCHIIQSVGAEYGAVGEGFGPSDDEVRAMSQHYTFDRKSLYLLAFVNGKLMGGCGVAPFNDRDDVCELKKLFLLKESRGLGLGRKLSEQCLEFALNQGFEQCYLDTLSNMTDAVSLYERMGFKHLTQPFEGTFHNGCDVWMMKSL
ncbi:GNAT family N-acetyltransferase [Vibrio maerlii]|uniref:GNAT family N-acetyltransferase n=1 Tax=Vibrio maerlii TaxID=2231648 RepID=UPI000E3B8534|nr:GNAT family N-acetyltransferase [Vibrio maerlii]